MQGIYRFKDKDNNIIYIGKAVNIKNRLKNGRHRGEGHLPEHAYDDTVRIEFTRIFDKSKLKEIEKYYITKYNPKYNTQYADYTEPNIIEGLENVQWTMYWERDMVKYDLERFKKDYFVNYNINNKEWHSLLLNIDIDLEDYVVATSSSDVGFKYKCYLAGVSHGGNGDVEYTINKCKHLNKLSKIYALQKKVKNLFLDFKRTVCNNYPNIQIEINPHNCAYYEFNCIILDIDILSKHNNRLITSERGFLLFKE